MFTKLNRFSLIAALCVAAASAAANAGDDKVQVAMLESGNPHSVEFARRSVARSPATSDDVEALEIGNPHSVNYGNRPAAQAATNEQIRSLEIGNPDAVK